MTSYIAILQNQSVTQMKTSPLRTHFISWTVKLTEEITPLCDCENEELCNTSLCPWVPTSLGFLEVAWFCYLRARCPKKKVLWPYELIWEVCPSYLKLSEGWQFQNNLANNLCMEKKSVQDLNIASLPHYIAFAPRAVMTGELAWPLQCGWQCWLWGETADLSSTLKVQDSP